MTRLCLFVVALSVAVLAGGQAVPEMTTGNPCRKVSMVPQDMDCTAKLPMCSVMFASSFVLQASGYCKHLGMCYEMTASDYMPDKPEWENCVAKKVEPGTKKVKPVTACRGIRQLPEPNDDYVINFYCNVTDVKLKKTLHSLNFARAWQCTASATTNCLDLPIISSDAWTEGDCWYKGECKTRSMKNSADLKLVSSQPFMCNNSTNIDENIRGNNNNGGFCNYWKVTT